MLITSTLYVALAIFLVGCVYKISRWFSFQIQGIPRESSLNTGARVLAALKGIVSTVLSPKIVTLIKVFVLDVMFQRRLLRQSRSRWAVHMATFVAMSYLILLHALGKVITASFFPNYYSTVNPFFFLRNFFGILIFIGLLFAVCRRYVSKRQRRFSNGMDLIIILLLGFIIVSGIVLESAEISSHRKFIRMVEDYSGLDPDGDAKEIKALESVWVKEFGVVSPNVREPIGADMLDQGLDTHKSYCAQCHSSAPWAFASYGLSRLVSPVALTLDRINFPSLMWYIHYLVSLIALACLPFTKMFHVFVSPLSLLANAVMDKNSNPVNVATRQVMELDACVHCGICNESCTNAGAFAAMGNTRIMPSEKMVELKTLVSGKHLAKTEIRAIQNGFFFCTHCQNCTDSCPVGINLQALWLTARDAFLQKGFPEFFLLSPLSIHRAIRRIETLSILFRNPLIQLRQIINAEFRKYTDDTHGNALSLADIDPAPKKKLLQSFQGHTSTTCFSCMTCSLACPVVANYDNPNAALGLLPHQVIHSANLGLLDMVFGSNMLWSCLGCYECQESCPQGVCVTDIFYELKNMAITHFEEKAQMP